MFVKIKLSTIGHFSGGGLLPYFIQKGGDAYGCL